MVTLQVKDLVFRYASTDVFSGVTIDVEKGSVVSIVGRNGAGKSTLLKCLNHVLTPRRGTVLVEGMAVERMSLQERAQRLGYLAQRSDQLFPTTVFDVVLTGRFPHSPLRFTAQDCEITARVLALMELDGFAHRLFNHLSGGEQQQVLIARALAQNAGVLLLDEPTNNLDLRHQLQIMRLVRRVTREKEITAIMAIHDLNLAAAYSDLVIVMHRGGIHAAGCPALVLTDAIIREVFGVDVKVYDHHGVPHIVMVDEGESHCLPG